MSCKGRGRTKNTTFIKTGFKRLITTTFVCLHQGIQSIPLQKAVTSMTCRSQHSHHLPLTQKRSVFIISAADTCAPALEAQLQDNWWCSQSERMEAPRSTLGCALHFQMQLDELLKKWDPQWAWTNVFSAVCKIALNAHSQQALEPHQPFAFAHQLSGCQRHQHQII